jgi:hypothetical protein
VREVSNRETRRIIGARDRSVEERRARRGNLFGRFGEGEDYYQREGRAAAEMRRSSGD